MTIVTKEDLGGRRQLQGEDGASVGAEQVQSWGALKSLATKDPTPRLWGTEVGEWSGLSLQ